jgi:hypothetical protein
LLRLPLPDVIDQAAVVAPPLIVAPFKVMGVGLVDWQTTSGPPALTVGNGLTVMVLVALTAAQGAGALVVSVKVTTPL